MTTGILDIKVGDSPEPKTYAAGALVEFKVTSYKPQAVTGGRLVRVMLKPVDVIDWPEDYEAPDVSQLPLTSKTFFFMDNQPSALNEFSKDMETYVGIEHNDENTLRDILEELRGAAVTFFVADGPNERGDYKLYLRHNND